MAEDKAKAQMVAFKVDKSLLEAMDGIPNRSEFIRNAVLAALDGVCPICKGTGILTPNQRRHWSAFAADHFVAECEECHELRLVCAMNKDAERAHGRRKSSA